MLSLVGKQRSLEDSNEVAQLKRCVNQIWHLVDQIEKDTDQYTTTNGNSHVQSNKAINSPSNTWRWKLRSRTYASGGQSSGSGSSSKLWVIGGGTAAAAVALWYYGQKMNDSAGGPSKSTEPKDYKAVHKAIVDLLESDESTSYEDGSYGPIFLRLAWHASGTYDKDTKTGGSNGATMRFVPESGHGANAGLHVARNALEPLKKQFPWISYSDLWTLAGATAVQQMSLGRVKVPWRPGRSDKDESYCTPDGRLPDAALGQKHLRDIFYRMGFNDQEIVALSGGHALGRCHRDRSGFDGPWTFSPTVLTNDFFRLLLNEKWQVRKWDGPKQYTDKQTDSLMMLPTDMSLVQDKEFKKYVQVYADDEDKFFKDFGNVVSRLFELGVPFPETSISLNLPYVE